MHSQLALTELSSPNLAPFILLNSVHPHFRMSHDFLEGKKTMTLIPIMREAAGEWSSTKDWSLHSTRVFSVLVLNWWTDKLFKMYWKNTHFINTYPSYFQCNSHAKFYPHIFHTFSSIFKKLLQILFISSTTKFRFSSFFNCKIVIPTFYQLHLICKMFVG